MNRLILLLVFVLMFFDFSYSNMNREYAIKAAYIEKISKYIEWPKQSESFTICVLGESSITQSLKNIASRVKIKNKKIFVREIESINEINDCQVLFIPKNQRSKYSKVFDKIKKQNILSIGEDDEISVYGVHINFFFESDNTLHFEINHELIKKSGLMPDLQLIELGKRRN